MYILRRNLRIVNGRQRAYIKAMAYTPKEWKARKGTGLNRFTKSGETIEKVYLENTPDSVTEPGTAFTPEDMNHIEEGVSDAHKGVAAAHEAIDKHINNKNNPHEVTKANIGLGDVDNVKQAPNTGSLTAGSGTDVDTPAQEATSTVWGLLQGIWDRIFAINTKINRVENLGPGYGTSSTEAGTAAKVGTLAGFIRSAGAIVGINFSYANTAASPTLNVNSTGAAAIRDFRTNAAPVSGAMGATAHLFQFDGTYWILLNPVIEAGGGTGPSGGDFWSGSDTGGDPNLITTPGFYSGLWTANTPTGADVRASLLVLPAGIAAAYRPQVMVSYDRTQMWFRSYPTSPWYEVRFKASDNKNTGPLYRHDINVTEIGGGSALCYFNVINNRPDQLSNVTAIAGRLYAAGHVGIGTAVAASGVAATDTSVISVYASSATTLKLIYMQAGSLQELQLPINTTTVSDTVTPV